MNILITGAKGFVGKNLVENLKNIKEGKNSSRSEIHVDNIFEYDIDTDPAFLDTYCETADFVFNLAGVNRPKDKDEFMEGNFGFASTLLNTLKKHQNKATVMLSSSIQATLIGRYGITAYGKSKLAGEELFFDYGKETRAKVLVYRFVNLFGKWCRPNYNSVLATFCNNIANDLEIKVHDRGTQLELIYIDDLVNEMLDALEGKEHRCEYPKLGEIPLEGYEKNLSIASFDGLTSAPCKNGKYCYTPISYKVTLGEVVDLLEVFKKQPESLLIPEIPNDSFAKKLYSTYLSYLPESKVKFALNMNVDERGSFTEIMKTISSGQFSVNISRPGIRKGQHWHNTKWEFFIVVSGHGLIQERKIGTEEVLNFEVSGDKIEAIHMLPGYTHNIINQSEKENLVTLMWANECFDPKKPDTFFEEVKVVDILANDE